MVAVSGMVFASRRAVIGPAASGGRTPLHAPRGGDARRLTRRDCGRD
jgi:hypothetical protein